MTRQEIAERVPDLPTLDRATYTLRLWKNLKLVKAYTVAVGGGLETPAGLHSIQDKQVDPTWNVPNPPGRGTWPGSRSRPGPRTR